MAAITQQLLSAAAFHPILTGLPTIGKTIFADGTPWIRYGFFTSNGIFQTEVGSGNNGVNPNAGYPAGSDGQINQLPQWGGQNAYAEVGRMFEVMCEVVSGSAPNTGSSGAINTWLSPQSGTTLWVRQQAFVGAGSDSGVWRFSVRRNGGATVLAQADYNWSLTRS